MYIFIYSPTCMHIIVRLCSPLSLFLAECLCTLRDMEDWSEIPCVSSYLSSKTYSDSERKWGHAVEFTLLFSPLENSLHDEIGERKLKGFLSIHSRGCSKRSSRCDYAPVSMHFPAFAWRSSPALSCGKWNINIFDLFVLQDVSRVWLISCLEMRCAVCMS